MRTARPWLVAGSLVLGAALVLSACGSSFSAAPAGDAGANDSAGDDGGGDAGEGGQAGHAAGQGGVNSGGMGGHGGGVVLGNTRTESCIAYAEAYCQRSAECHGTMPKNCLEVSFGCPDLIFSPGATRTISSANACAKSYLGFACDKMNAGDLPDCVTPGTRKANEACLYNSQCVSLSCSASGNACGTCAALGSEGAVCSATVPCESSLVCDPSGHCAATLSSSCASSCPVDQYCDSALEKCKNRPDLAQPCTDATGCVSTAYCDSVAHTCVAQPTLGLPCGMGSDGSSNCAGDLFCSTVASTMGTCQPLPMVGEPCFSYFNSTTLTNVDVCADGATCNTATTPPTCVAKAAKGAACSLSTDCATGLLCTCSDVGRANPGCTKACYDVRVAGQACGLPGVVCHPGFDCVAGLCQVRDSQGTFARCSGAVGTGGSGGAGGGG